MNLSHQMKLVNDISDQNPPPKPSARTTWQVYKSRFVPMQILILVVALTLYFVVNTPKEKLVVYIIGLELFAIFSAYTGAKMARRIFEGK